MVLPKPNNELHAIKDSLIPATVESRLPELISDKCGWDNYINFLFTEETLL
jgi:hypothetical protein